MDIKPSANLQTPLVLNKPVENLLTLKVGQKLDARVINALVKTEINRFALKIGNQTVTVQSSQPIKLEPGQNLQIQVIRLSPVIEFEIIGTLPDLKRPPLAPDIRLMLAPAEQPDASPALPVNRPLSAKVTGISESQIRLQVFTGSGNRSGQEAELTKPFIMITVDRSQLRQTGMTAANLSPPGIPAASSASAKTMNPAAELKIGQSVILEIDTNNGEAEIKIFAAEPNTDEKISTLIKQLLPRHESSPVLLNQLLHDLPQLVKSSTVPELLKRLAAELLQNLPQRQQLTESAVLKQSVLNSGVFLEAKLAQLNENPASSIEQDFKAELLKFIHELKKEAANPGEPGTQDSTLVLLKNLQQKTENTVAKMILDQLTSLPKEEHPKQVWAFDIPFVDRDRAETVSIQIERDKDNDRQPDQTKWSVTITMTPPGLGTIQCRLSFHHDTINSCFHSRQPETVRLIRQHLDYLKQQLEEAGLKTGMINVRDGLQPTGPIYQNIRTKLLDEKA